MPAEIDPVIRRSATAKALGGVSRRTLADWEKSGVLPPPIRLSRNVIGWRRSTIERLIAERSGESGKFEAA